MDENCIGDLIALAKRIDGIADDIAAETENRDPRGVELFRIALHLRRIIARLPG